MMKMYDSKTIYVIGEARTQADNAITKEFNSFFIGFVVRKEDGKIIDLSCSSKLRTTDDFVYSIFINHDLNKIDAELEKEIKKRYFGSSQKAIIVAYRDAVRKYNKIKDKYLNN